MKRRRPAARPTPVPSAPPRDRPRAGLVQAALLAAATILLYANSLGHGFVYDDVMLITNNPHLPHTAQLWPDLFTSKYFDLAGGEASYRPVTTLSYFLTYAIWRLDPLGYHLLSVLLHLANVLLVYLLAQRVFPARATAFIAALFFACHPINTEAINAITFNEEPLTLFFMLSSLLVYTTSQPRGGARSVALAVPLYLLALFAKEMALTLPLLLLLYEVLFDLPDGQRTPIGVLRLVKDRAVAYAAFTAATVLYAVLRFWVLTNGHALPVASSDSLLWRLVFLPRNLLYALSSLCFPFRLSADYPFAYPDTFFDGTNLLGYAALAALLALAFFTYRRARGVAFGIFFVPITVVPVMNLFLLYNPRAERYLYVPALGFCFAVAAALSTTPARPRYALLVAVLAAFSLRTITRNPVWQSDETLWAATLAGSPASYRANASLGFHYYQKGQLEPAIAIFQRALTLNPNDADAHRLLGASYYRQGRLRESLAELTIAVALRPNSHESHYNLGVAQEDLGAIDAAKESYQRSIRISPYYTKPRYSLGNLYLGEGRLDAAEKEYLAVLKSDPGHLQARFQLGDLYMRRHAPDSALAEYDAILGLAPGNTAALNNRGSVLAELSRVSEAIAVWQEVLRRDPRNQDARARLEHARSLQAGAR